MKVEIKLSRTIKRSNKGKEVSEVFGYHAQSTYFYIIIMYLK